MINETILVRQYLNGENINPNCLYRICFLLAKWYKEQGIEDKLQVRTNIFEWANKYGVYLPLYLNACIDNAFGMLKPLLIPKVNLEFPKCPSLTGFISTLPMLAEDIFVNLLIMAI